MSKNYARIEMDLAFGTAKPYGSSRSIVRRIASSLPLKPSPRVHFQLYPYTEDAGILFAAKRQPGLVASLADVGWIDGDDEDDAHYLGRPRHGLPAGLWLRAHEPQQRLTRQRSLPSLYQGPPDPQGSTIANDEAIQKISALETELAKLRAQIAQIVLAQEKTSQPAAATGAPPPPPPPSGTLPPPPPPPPAIDLIKERKGKKTDSQTVLEPKPAEIPNMLDILKDMGKVKLRSVKNRDDDGDVKAKTSEPTDAAALIAEALKRKFAHRYRHNSEQEDKEDFKPLTENKAKPASPLFGQHMLKRTGMRKLV
uniref:Mitochondrial fission regulator n=1 Tax=Periophthalmus magnuspinnatus TaxID=409849 RepID=A0A3B4BLF8_9GOBI